jgi:hypothetical protein
MKTSALLGMSAAAFACAVLIGMQPMLSPAQQKEAKAPAPTRWEYKRAENPSDAALTKLGEEGWDLVTVLGGQPYVEQSTTSTPPVVAGGPVTTTKNAIGYGKSVYVFKRPR